MSGTFRPTAEVRGPLWFLPGPAAAIRCAIRGRVCAGYLIVWDAYNGEFELCGYRYEDDDRLRVWLREEFGMVDEPRPLLHDGELGQLGGEA